MTNRFLISTYDMPKLSSKQQTIYVIVCYTTVHTRNNSVI